MMLTPFFFFEPCRLLLWPPSWKADLPHPSQYTWYQIFQHIPQLFNFNTSKIFVLQSLHFSPSTLTCRQEKLHCYFQNNWVSCWIWYLLVKLLWTSFYPLIQSQSTLNFIFSLPFMVAPKAYLCKKYPFSSIPKLNANPCTLLLLILLLETL